MQKKGYTEPLSDLFLLLKKTALISATLIKINLYIWEISFFRYLLFNSSPVNTLGQKTRNYLDHIWQRRFP